MRMHFEVVCLAWRIGPIAADVIEQQASQAYVRALAP